MVVVPPQQPHVSLVRCYMLLLVLVICCWSVESFCIVPSPLSVVTGTIRTSRSSSLLKMSVSNGDAAGGASRLLLSMLDQLGRPDGKACLILASQSPRRKEILDMMGLMGRFDAMPSPLDETVIQERLRSSSSNPVDPLHYAQTLAEEKAKALAETLEESQQPTLVLGSDTIVELQGEILEKPVCENDAIRTLSQLSGRQHFVHTGVAIYCVTPLSKTATLISAFVDTATVTFCDLSLDDIKAYVATGEPMDKAGSYGIQGIGGQFVKAIDGDFFTVMGLPMHPVSRELAKALASIGS